MDDPALDYGATLTTLLGLMGKRVGVELSNADQPGIQRAAAGFRGVLAHGRDDEIVRHTGDREAMNFTVAIVGDDESPEPWFMVDPSTFETAVVVRGPLAPSLAIRTNGLDITVTPEDSTAL